MGGFSIVLCTYNPDLQILERLFAAILAFDSSSPAHEVILVDNNSEPPIVVHKLVQDFLNAKQNSKIIRETKPGLTSARLAGIQQASFDWIVFFDDDNEPCVDYLIEALIVIKQFPPVGAWGPGVIKVNYVDVRENRFLKSLRPLFQERFASKLCFDNNKVEGSECYPSGTGLIIKTDVSRAYLDAVSKNEFTMIDRNAGNLTSGGDSQLVYMCLRLGYYAGSTPAIKLTHNILPSKLAIRKVVKLTYLLNAGQVKAYNEVFTEHPYSITKIQPHMINNLLLSFFKRALKHPFNLKHEILILAKNLGMIKAQIIAGDQTDPFIIRQWEKLVNA
jgi:glycosyltransferase involved in cell wall biosynthesis